MNQQADPTGTPAPVSESGDRVSVDLVHSDSGDCMNTGVTGPLAGTVLVVQEIGIGYDVFIEINEGVPNTTYVFSVKCVRPLGEVQTDANGEGQTRSSLEDGELNSLFGLEGVPARPIKNPTMASCLQSQTIKLPGVVGV